MDEPRGFAFPFRIDPSTGGVAASAGDRKLRDNLLLLLQVELGERLLRRDYGAGLGGLLQEPINTPFFALIRSQIARAVARYEPRVEIVELRVEASTDTGEVRADLTYLVRATRTPARASVALRVAP
jgi:Bacteriophage baseplate protein W